MLKVKKICLLDGLRRRSTNSNLQTKKAIFLILKKLVVCAKLGGNLDGIIDCEILTYIYILNAMTMTIHYTQKYSDDLDCDYYTVSGRKKI